MGMDWQSCRLRQDGWSVRTIDHALSAHEKAPDVSLASGALQVSKGGAYLR